MNILGKEEVTSMKERKHRAKSINDCVYLVLKAMIPITGKLHVDREIFTDKAAMKKLYRIQNALWKVYTDLHDLQKNKMQKEVWDYEEEHKIACDKLKLKLDKMVEKRNRPKAKAKK